MYIEVTKKKTLPGKQDTSPHAPKYGLSLLISLIRGSPSPWLVVFWVIYEFLETQWVVGATQAIPYQEEQQRRLCAS